MWFYRHAICCTLVALLMLLHHLIPTQGASLLVMCETGYVCCTCAGRAAVKEAMGICDAVPMKGHAWDLINWAATPFSLFAEGSYPFPCNYLTNGGGSLPAYPMRVACNTFLSQPMNGTDLLAGTKHSHILIPVGIACFLSDEDVCGCATKQET